MTKQNRTRLEALQLAAIRSTLEARYPDNPKRPDSHYNIPKLKDTTANGLTRCIVTFLECNGHQAERINTMGTYRKGTKAVNFWTGRVTEIGGGYTPTTGTKGSADISATIHGQSVKIEVKFGADRMSEHQRAYQAAIERAGGVYYVARTFDDFVTWYDSCMGRRMV